MQSLPGIAAGWTSRGWENTGRIISTRIDSNTAEAIPAKRYWNPGLEYASTMSVRFSIWPIFKKSFREI